jgi:CheY-like chemotaxis protein
MLRSRAIELTLRQRALAGKRGAPEGDPDHAILQHCARRECPRGGLMKCPRCSAVIAATPDEMGLFVCAKCGAKLRSKSPAVVKVQMAPAQPPKADTDSLLARLEVPQATTHGADPSATLPPGTQRPKIRQPEQAPLTRAPAVSLETLLAEIQGVRQTQEEILALLVRQAAASTEPPDEKPLPPMRTRRRKTVLLIDDDDASLEVAREAMEKAEIPVKTAVDGSGGLAAIAMEKPDVIVLELDLQGAMAGGDVVNMIKSTMEWIDIPIVLYTRMEINQKDARALHGADEIAPKSKGAEALVAKVIALFRKA